MVEILFCFIAVRILKIKLSSFSFLRLAANDRDYAYWRFAGALAVEMRNTEYGRKTWHCSSPAITHRRVLCAGVFRLSSQ